jgi:hypothetical protein
MSDFLTASQNIPFTVALAVMFGIAVLEGVLTLIGVGFSNVIESLMPDVDFDVDADLSGPEVQSATPLSRLLGWLRIGKVPVLMLLVIFLTAFGLIGIAIQSFFQSTAGFMLPAAVASIPALLLALPVMRVFGSIISKLMPKDETDAISIETLIGRVATITLGTAKPGSPAEARVRDMHGTTHYVMVEPDAQQEEFSKGDDVLLVRRAGSVFKVINNTNPSLVNK